MRVLRGEGLTNPKAAAAAAAAGRRRAREDDAREKRAREGARDEARRVTRRQGGDWRTGLEAQSNAGGFEKTNHTILHHTILKYNTYAVCKVPPCNLAIYTPSKSV